MAFPSANLNDLTLAWAVIRNAAADIKRKTDQLSTAAAVTTISGQQIITYLQELVGLRATMVAYISTPGLLAYVREQVNSGTVDVVAEWNTMNGTITGVVDWVRNNFPKDANGYLLDRQLDAAGVVQLRTFTPATLTGLVAQLNTLSATIA
jgi:hypothetical protein